MKKIALLPVLLLPLASCDLFSNPKTFDGTMTFGAQYSGSSGHLGPTEGDYRLSENFPALQTVLYNYVYSEGADHGLFLPKVTEEVSSFTLTFKESYKITKIRAFGAGEGSLVVSFAGAEMSGSFLEAKPESLPLNGPAIAFAQESTGAIPYLAFSNQSREGDLHLSKLVITFEKIEESSASSEISSSSEESSISSEKSSSSESTEVPVDYGNLNPTEDDYSEYAAKNKDFPESSGTTRLKPVSVPSSAELAPIYRLVPNGGNYLRVLNNYLSRKKMCFTFEDVAEYYMAFRQVPPNYFASKAPNGNRTYRKLSVYHKGNYSGSNDYTKALSKHWNVDPGGAYYELDIDLTSNYNNGFSYTRGKGRVVVIDEGINEKGYGEEPVMYFTNDHYQNFVEYYNFKGGWSAPFAGTSKKQYEARSTPTTVSF